MASSSSKQPLTTPNRTWCIWRHKKARNGMHDSTFGGMSGCRLRQFYRVQRREATWDLAYHSDENITDKSGSTHGGAPQCVVLALRGKQYSSSTTTPFEFFSHAEQSCECNNHGLPKVKGAPQKLQAQIQTIMGAGRHSKVTFRCVKVFYSRGCCST